MGTKKLFLIALLLIVGWSGNYYYKHNKNLEFAGTPKNTEHNNEITYSKCITDNGEKIYGDIPKGKKCNRLESITLPSTSNNFDQKNLSGDTKNFKCDGRQHCSQMTSCAEAMHFNDNCPGTKMDSDGDGLPCERQWCGN